MIRAQLRVVFGAATFFWEQDENQSSESPIDYEYEYNFYQTCIKG